MQGPSDNEIDQNVTALSFADSAAEAGYRAHFLHQDRRDAIIAIAVFVFFKVTFSVFDLMFQTPEQVDLLLEARFGFAAVSIATMMLFARVRSARHYDALMLAWVLLAVLSNFFTIAHRPSGHFGFLGTSPMLILLLFVFFRNRFNLQLLSAAVLTASDFFTVFSLRVPLPTQTLIQTAATYALAIIIGAIVSWQLHSARRRYFATHSNERRLRARLQELAYRDELTGVLNRRSFLQEAEALWRKSAQSNRPACLLMLDLDHFKQINDTLGHEAGDRALVAFAHLVQSSKRPGDIFGRVGGEEFALFLPDASANVARDVAARIVRECQALAPDGQPQQHLSVSIGLAAVNSSDNDLRATMARADKALYQAKADGRGRTALAVDAIASTH
ncbi:MAG: GGDEF domain-containing protein [Xanthomonadales bacterium]|nr:GGDEF domain-containing protein [Xanthomonadales bacterium]MDZ4115539.1 GGDEF domain-containing protein [Xanthomonadaceae bacterium]MDZ4379031.1 GGDEF domain-containing protein [Xanthomonadaceae bacterium]